MLEADVVALDWEVQRWRRLKLAPFRGCQVEALKNFLPEKLDCSLCTEEFLNNIAEILEENSSEDQPNAAEQMAQACAQNELDAVDKVSKICSHRITGHGRHQQHRAGPQSGRSRAKVRTVGAGRRLACGRAFAKANRQKFCRNRNKRALSRRKFALESSTRRAAKRNCDLG